MPSVLIIDDEREITGVLGTFFERAGHEVMRAHTGEEGIAWVKRARPDLVLLDLRLPDMTGFDVLERVREEHPVVIMITGHGDVALAVQAMQSGAESFLTKPIELAHLGAAADRAFEKTHLRRMNRYLTERRGRVATGPLLGSSPPMRELAEQIDMLAQSDRTTVLLVGESGTGKGRVAEAIHRQSPRAGGQFIEVNCAALTAASLDAELFGQ
jgi:DNA-binding NtrC family response regulator